MNGVVPDVLEPTPSADEPLVPSMPDEDPATDVVEVSLVARAITKELVPGEPTTVWAYNGTSPGPLLRANVGDRVLVHFRNELDEATSVHWHGLRVPAEMDGGAEGPIVAAGGSFDFEFVVPDAGLFWYHPHEHSARQVEMGLFGPIVVRSPDEPAVDVERVLVLDDVLVDADGDIASFSSRESMLGRQGNLILVDGIARPTAHVRAGSVERWRIVNVANARYFELDVPGHDLFLVGTDGGLLESPVPIERPLVAPGERIDVVLVARGEPGSTIDVKSRAYDRGHAMDWGDDVALFRMQYTDEAPLPTRELPSFHGVVETLPPPAGRDELVLDEEHCSGHGHGGCNLSFSINGETWPDVTPLHARLGETRAWRIVNDSAMDHPMHLHGFRFQVLARDGVAEKLHAWKDTVNVRHGEEVELAVSFDGFAGDWMYHCHILEHAERGMMGLVSIAP